MSTRGILALCTVLAVVGWVGLGSFTYYNAPDTWNRLIATAMLWPTLVASLLPLLYWFHQRRGGSDSIVRSAARQSALASSFLTLCLWLRILQGLNWVSGTLMALLFVLAEILLSAQENQR